MPKITRMGGPSIEGILERTSDVEVVPEPIPESEPVAEPVSAKVAVTPPEPEPEPVKSSVSKTLVAPKSGLKANKQF